MPFDQISSTDRRQLSSVRILLSDAQPTIGNVLRASLVKEGFDGIQLFHQFEDLRKGLIRGATDLVIIDLEFGSPVVVQAIRDIREGRLGENPFIPIIVTCRDPDEESVQPILNAGTDDIVAKPISVSIIFQRINKMVHNRRPFAVTSTYIGPDRRDDPARDRSKDGLIAVPNTLRLKVQGEKPSRTTITSAVTEARRHVNSRRLESYSPELARLAMAIQDAYAEPKAGPKTETLTIRLEQVAEDVVARLEHSPYAGAAELCRNLLKVASNIRHAHPQPAKRDLALLPQLAEAIALAFSQADDGTEEIKQITQSLGSYMPANRAKDLAAADLVG